MQKNTTEKWFWAWLVQMTIPKAAVPKLNAKVEVWKNLVIVRARSPKLALTKALKIGMGDQGDCEGSLRLDGKPAVTKFLGIQNIGVIHDELSDGAEIVWDLERCTQKTARQMVKSHRVLLANLNKEFGHLKDPNRKPVSNP